MKYDYLIIGSGLFGSIFAREATNNGFKCLVIDKRNHIGGNCFTKKIDGIDVHEYGPHIFHTNSIKVWNYMNKWTEFNHFTYRPRVNYKNKIYSFPINLMTLYQLWGTKTPEEAIKKLNEVKVKIDNPSNLEEWILTQVGEELYQTFVYGYTKKQWGKHPNELPSFIIKRLPIRLTYNDNYFDDIYQGIPVDGYTAIFEKLLYGINVDLNTDYLNDREYFNKLAKKIIYTGPIDEFFNYEYGMLEWRSLKFEHEHLNIPDYQGVATVNYTDESIPYTRICEHKHFTFGKQNTTVITKEYPQSWDKTKEKYYPVNDNRNNELFLKYKKQIDNKKYIFGGRLADYKYYDMHQVVGSALEATKKEFSLT
jgi:UDP-galactopyranose mutase